MPTRPLDRLLAAALHIKEQTDHAPVEDVIAVSETVSRAASMYEAVRNVLEYDEEHLIRRNAIRRIIRRRLGEGDALRLAQDVVHELVWGRYVPNKKLPLRFIQEIAQIFQLYEPLFERLESLGTASHAMGNWLLDVLATHVEYHLVPPVVDDALANFVFEDLKSRLEWTDQAVPPADRDVQLYMAVHRAILRADAATLRFRLFTLYYPAWLEHPPAAFVEQIAEHIDAIMEAVERQVRHPFADSIFRLVRRHTVVYHVLTDLVIENPALFAAPSAEVLTPKVVKAAKARYTKFYSRLHRTLFRAVIFLFFTKMLLGLAIEVPYDTFIAKEGDWLPLFTNIVFPPLLLALIGLSVRIPETKNTEKIKQELFGILGIGPSWIFRVAQKRVWARGAAGIVFHTLYVGALLATIGTISFVLSTFGFHAVSILLFLFFLSLVLFFGLRIRGAARDLTVVETTTSFLGTILDVFFLPVIRLGRWISLRAPRVNFLLFFLDFMIDAPFKSAIRLVEGWLAFLREKKEEL